MDTKEKYCKLFSPVSEKEETLPLGFARNVERALHLIHEITRRPWKVMKTEHTAKPHSIGHSHLISLTEASEKHKSSGANFCRAPAEYGASL